MENIKRLFEISQRILQAHCQSHTNHHFNQSFIKELAKPTHNRQQPKQKKNTEPITRGIKHWGLSGYSSVLHRIKLSVTGQVSSPQSPTISYRNPLPAIMRHFTMIIASVSFLFFLSCQNIIQNENQVHKLGESGAPFSHLKCDKIVAVDFPGNTDIPLIDTNGQITNTATQEKLLDNNQIDEFNKILMDSTTFGAQWPVDFYPHFGLVFYKNDKIVDHLEVSLICNNLFASFPIPQKEKQQQLSNGLTKTGVKRIFDFCKQLGFKNYLDSVKHD